MEPLDDVVPVGIGHHHHDEDGLVPDDAPEELTQEGGLAPAHVEEADHAAQEDQEVGGAQVGAGPTDPLQQERAWQHQHGQQDGVGHVDPEDEDQDRRPQGPGAAARRRPHRSPTATSDHRRPRRHRLGQLPVPPRAGPRRNQRSSPNVGDLAHGWVGGSLIGPPRSSAARTRRLEERPGGRVRGRRSGDCRSRCSTTVTTLSTTATPPCATSAGTDAAHLSHQGTDMDIRDRASTSDDKGRACRPPSGRASRVRRDARFYPWPSGHRTKSEPPLTFREFLSTLWRRRLTILVTVVVAVVAALAYSKVQTPKYQSTAMVQENGISSRHRATRARRSPSPTPSRSWAAPRSSNGRPRSWATPTPAAWPPRSPARSTPPPGS